MDEPLASLDHARKAEILPFIERMRDEFDVPIVYVSHSADEVARLATDVVVIDNGCRLAQGSPAVVLPLKTTGMGLGAGELTSRISATVGAYLPHYGITLLAHPAGAIALPGSFEANAHSLRLLIQESAVRLHPARLAASAIPNTLRGTLITIEPLDGAFIRAVMALEGGDTLSVRTTRYMLDQLALRTGDDVWAIVDAAAVERSAHPQP
jgi:molybdate transport system ATP-binding protein